jgi:hypothetical protein
MPFSGVFNVDLAPVYLDLDNSLGVYVVDPGEVPFIALDLSLKDKDDQATNQVYRALVDFHNSLPDVYRLFPLTVCYEDLPHTTPEDRMVMLPSKRCFHCGVYTTRIRLVGS